MTEVEPSVPDEAARSSAASLSERFPDPSARPAIPAEEAELDQFESYHRGPLAGMARLADLADLATTPDPPDSAPETKSARDAIAGEWRKIVAARVGYDVMDPFDTSLEAAAKQMSQPWQPVAKEPVSRVPRDPDLFDQLFPDDHLWTPDPGAKRLRRIVAKAIFEMTAEPLINVGRALTGTLPEEEWPDFVADGLLAALGPGGTAGKPVARGLKKLPMDEANRMARARKQGYAEEPLYRGEASGELPMEFPAGAFFRATRNTLRDSRGAAVTLSHVMKKAFRDQGDLTVEEYGRLVSAANQTNPKLASDLVDMAGLGRDVQWFMDFARTRPDDILWKGNAGLVRQAITVNDPKWRSIFVRAGFTVLDFGGDVLTLTGKGMRLKEAAFDPARKHDPNLMASILGGALVGPALTDDPNRE